jgi:hypothetical protein
MKQNNPDSSPTAMPAAVDPAPPMTDSNQLAPYVLRMAQTGEGTDACLELGCLPMLVHFYSPVPDIKDLFARGLFQKKSTLPGIDFRPEKQLEFLADLGRKYGAECRWPPRPTGADPAEFFLFNDFFSFGCAASLHTMVRNFKPKRLWEIGSGFSSRIISSALTMNLAEGFPCDYGIVDPYPGDVVKNHVRGVSRLIQERVQCTDAGMYDELGVNDILFIDSSHSVKFGSDVNFLILEVLPRLAPGVVVHLHDINIPYAPPPTYFTNPACRMFWNEEFLLQAFLLHNDRFEILLAMNFLQMEHMDTFAAAFPHFKLEENWAMSGSFWMRRKS